MNNRYLPLLGYIDLLNCLLAGFIFLFVVSACLIQIKQITTQTTAERTGDFLIEMTYPAGNYDLDLWVKAPTQEMVGFKNKDGETMSLLHDDTGGVTGEINKEEVTIREALVGEYIVNVHYYEDYRANLPLEAKVILKDFAGKTVVENTVKLEVKGDEVTAFSFMVDRSKVVSGIDKNEQSRWVQGIPFNWTQR